MRERTLSLPELLSPAGDRERLEAAVRFGADAVYLGSSEYTMRSAPKNFSHTQVAEAVAYCHQNGVQVYLTCNTLPRNDEADGIGDYLRFVGESGADGLIVADIGVMMAARRLIPQVELHMSTQTGIVNWRAACELHALGAKRVVLARELSLEEIRVIREKTPQELELECFVHGAMCMSFSGRCLLSNYMTGRDGNRGQCAQPCRWSYRLMEEKRPGEYFPIFEDESGSYILNARDLCMIEHLDKLAAAGVSSFKIEGRNKSAYYVAVITAAYRAALGELGKNPGHYELPQWIVEETRRVRHRDYCTGFYFGVPQQGQYYESGGYVSRWEVAAVVTGWRDGWLSLSQRNRFAVGDELEVLEPGQRPVSLRVTAMRDGEGNAIEACPHATMELSIPSKNAFPPGSLLRKCKENE